MSLTQKGATQTGPGTTGFGTAVAMNTDGTIMVISAPFGTRIQRVKKDTMR